MGSTSRAQLIRSPLSRLSPYLNEPGDLSASRTAFASAIPYIVDPSFKQKRGNPICCSFCIQFSQESIHLILEWFNNLKDFLSDWIRPRTMFQLDMKYHGIFEFLNLKERNSFYLVPINSYHLMVSYLIFMCSPKLCKYRRLISANNWGSTILELL